jgi:hypothetical protein
LEVSEGGDSPPNVPHSTQAVEEPKMSEDPTVKAPLALACGDELEENFNRLSRIYKMIGGYDVEAQLRNREQERHRARKVLQSVNRDKKNEKRRLKRIKERVSNIKSDALPELMHFMIQIEVKRREKAELAKSKAQGRATSKASSSKCATSVS